MDEREIETLAERNRGRGMTAWVLGALGLVAAALGTLLASTWSPSQRGGRAVAGVPAVAPLRVEPRSADPSEAPSVEPAEPVRTAALDRVDAMVVSRRDAPAPRSKIAPAPRAATAVKRLRPTVATTTPRSTASPTSPKVKRTPSPASTASVERGAPPPAPAPTKGGRDVEGAKLHVAVAREYWERGNARVAAAEYGKAFALDGRNVDAVAGLAELAFADGRYKQAAQYYARASRLRPGSLRYLMNLGNAHLRAGQRSEAAAAFRQVLELSPGNPTAKRNLELAER